METETVAFSIKDKDLAEMLGLTLDKLEVIVAFFAVDPDHKWELREHDHYIYLNRKTQERLFSQQGAFTIAKYADALEAKSLWVRVREFILRKRQNVCRTFVAGRVRENCSSLLTKETRLFLSEKDVAAIFCTTNYRLRKAFYDILMSNCPMEYKDFDEIAGMRYYSLSGIGKLSRNFATELKVTDRREWCLAVGIVAPKILTQLASTKEKKLRQFEIEVPGLSSRFR